VINKPEITRLSGLELGCRDTGREGERRNLKEIKRKHRRGEMEMRNEGDMAGGEVKE